MSTNSLTMDPWSGATEHVSQAPLASAPAIPEFRTPIENLEFGTLMSIMHCFATSPMAQDNGIACANRRLHTAWRRMKRDMVIRFVGNLIDTLREYEIRLLPRCPVNLNQHMPDVVLELDDILDIV